MNAFFFALHETRGMTWEPPRVTLFPLQVSKCPIASTKKSPFDRRHVPVGQDEVSIIDLGGPRRRPPPLLLRHVHEGAVGGACAIGGGRGGILEGSLTKCFVSEEKFRTNSREIPKMFALELSSAL